LTPGASDDGARARRFEALILPHLDSAYNLALHLTRRTEAAEDVTHDAFARALAAFEAFRGGDARAWILAIVRNRAFDWLAQQRRLAAAPLAGPGDDADADDAFDPPDLGDPGPEATLIAKTETARLHAMIDALPAKLREVLVLREMEELNYRQIAEITGVPIGSVMSRLSRARARLRKAWADPAIREAAS
jgi:RNA polymerase sigma-70 factor (ECF subfamily)